MKDFIKKSEEQLLILCDNVRFLRQREGLSRRKMANRLKISVRSISILEKGIVPPRLSCEILFIIQVKFGINPNDILKKRLSKG